MDYVIIMMKYTERCYQNIWDAFFIPIFLPHFLALAWCSPRHLKKQIKLVAVKNSQKRAKLTQNKERVKTLKMKMMSQKTIVII